MNEEALKGKGSIGCFIFNVHICENWLVQEMIANKKEYNSVLWLIVFLRMPLLFLHWKQNSDSNRKCALSGLSAPCLLSCRCNQLTFYFDSCWTTRLSECNGSLCLWACKNTCIWHTKDCLTPRLNVSPLPKHILCCLVDFIYRTQGQRQIFIKNFRAATT